MKVLFIGYGSIAKKHKAALDRMYPSNQSFALRSKPDAPPIEGVINVFDWASVPRDIYFAIVSNPTAHHAEVLKKLVERNIPVFLEKPPACAIDGLAEIAEEIRRLQLPVYVACNLRFSPVLQFLYNNLGKKRVNEVVVYAGSYLPEWRPGTDFRQNYSSRAEMGGGVHLDLYHELDYVSWLFGHPVRSVAVLRNVSSLGINAIDFAVYAWEYPQFTAVILLNYFRRQPKRTVDISFEDDTWTVDILKSRIARDNGEIVFDAEGFNLLETYDLQMAYFIAALRNGQLDGPNTFDFALNTLKICLQEYEVKR